MHNQKTNILMTTDTIGGVWTYTMGLCRALKKYPLKIHLIGLGKLPTQNQENELKNLENVKFYPTDYKLEWMENAHHDIEKTRLKIIEIANDTSPHLFHFNNFICDIGYESTPKITVFHSCVQTWWKAVKSESAPVGWNLYKNHVEKALNQSNVVVFPAGAMREDARELYGINSSTAVISNARTHYPITRLRKKNMIFCSGRVWDEAKNMSAIFKIASNLPWPVYVAGDEKPKHESQKSDFENVRFLGKLTPHEMEQWHYSSKIYINPALYEPFGLAVLEAAHAGCALLLSDIKSLKELWQNEALFFDPNNEEDILNKVLTLIKNKELRNELREKSQNHARRFNSSKMGKCYYQLYRHLMKINSKNINTAKAYS